MPGGLLELLAHEVHVCSTTLQFRQLEAWREQPPGKLHHQRMRGQLRQTWRSAGQALRPQLMAARRIFGAAGDGESQRFNLLAVQQVIDHDAAVPIQHLQLLTDVHTVHHQREELKRLRLPRRRSQGHEGRSIADAQVLPAAGAKGVLRVLFLHRKSFIAAAISPRADLATFGAQVLSADGLECDLITEHPGREEVIAVLRDLVCCGHTTRPDDDVNRQHGASQRHDAVDGDLPTPAHLGRTGAGCAPPGSPWPST
mmetsp:Transcript_69167/g.109172  ORF Transcript_69167/g.109172 Transcript_69167/m.109172 type:complete len:256 (+) Transcript_69167:635-1402(+)